MLNGNKFYLALLLVLFSSLAAFGQDDKKAAYGILIDNTGSLRSQFDQVVTLGKAVAHHAAQKGPVSVFNFESGGDRRNPLALISGGSEWSQNEDALGNFIDGIYVLGGQTTLLDAVNSMARAVNSKIAPEKGGVVILITDGEERESHLKESELIKSLQKDGIKVYAIGLVRELGSGNFGSKGKRDKAEKLLRKLTKETGGRVVISDSRSVDADKLVNELFMSDKL
jgi:von Willebrand factor type A domain